MTDTEKTPAPDRPSSKEEAEEQTLLEQMGGISGLIYSSLPVVVFVLLNMLFGLSVAIWGALGSAALSPWSAWCARSRCSPRSPASSALASRRSSPTGRAGQGLLPVRHLGEPGLRQRVPRVDAGALPPGRRDLVVPERSRHGLARGPQGHARLPAGNTDLGRGLRRPVHRAALAVRPGPDRLAGLRPPRHGLPTDRDRPGGHGVGGHQSRPPGEQTGDEREETDQEIEERLRAKYAGKPEPEGA